MPDTSADREAAREALRASDEAFWKEQERTIQGALGQPCCTLSGISTSLMGMRGRFAVVIHGENECASCFLHTGPAGPRFFSTRLTDEQFLKGRTAGPLRECLELVATELRPEVVLVLGACPVEVIGDQFQEVVAEVGRAHPEIAFRALHTSGLKVGTQTAMLDWFFETLAGLPPVALDDELTRWDTPAEGVPLPAARQDALNLLGVPLPHRPDLAQVEPIGVLRQAGLELIGAYPSSTSLSAWRVIHHAATTFVADRSLYPKLMRVLESGGQAVQEVPLPVGIGPTLALYRAVGAAYGREEALLEAVEPLRQRAQAAVDAFRARFGGMRLAYGVRMVNNYQADLLAYQGLGDVAALEELGFDITLLVQGPPDKRDRFEQMFSRRGIARPFEMFREPWVLAEVFREGRFEVAVAADHVRNEAAKAGIPLLVNRSFTPWLVGVAETAQNLTHTLARSTRTRA